jgi:hypothetical protein
VGPNRDGGARGAGLDMDSFAASFPLLFEIEDRTLALALVRRDDFRTVRTESRLHGCAAVDARYHPAPRSTKACETWKQKESSHTALRSAWSARELLRKVEVRHIMARHPRIDCARCKTDTIRSGTHVAPAGWNAELTAEAIHALWRLEVATELLLALLRVAVAALVVLPGHSV